MPMVRAMRLLNTLESGTTSGAQLQALLANPGNLGEWQSFMTLRGQMRRMFASTTARTAVLASATAMSQVAKSPIAVQAMLDSPESVSAIVLSATAMSQLAANLMCMKSIFAENSAVAAIGPSTTAKMALFNSNTALEALLQNPGALELLRNEDYGYQLLQTTPLQHGSQVPSTLTRINASFIMLGISNEQSNSTVLSSVAQKRPGSTANSAFQYNNLNKKDGRDYDAALPLLGPVGLYQSTPDGGNWQLGLMRCDSNAFWSGT